MMCRRPCQMFFTPVAAHCWLALVVHKCSRVQLGAVDTNQSSSRAPHAIIHLTSSHSATALFGEEILRATLTLLASIWNGSSRVYVCSCHPDTRGAHGWHQNNAWKSETVNSHGPELESNNGSKPEVSSTRFCNLQYYSKQTTPKPRHAVLAKLYLPRLGRLR